MTALNGLLAPGVNVIDQIHVALCDHLISQVRNQFSPGQRADSILASKSRDTVTLTELPFIRAQTCAATSTWPVKTLTCWPAISHQCRDGGPIAFGNDGAIWIPADYET